MRVLILATDIYTRGGIARYTASLASGLGALVGPPNVEVLALLGSGTPEEVPEGYRVLAAISERLSATAKVRFVAKALTCGFHGYDLVVCSHVALAPVAAAIRALRGTAFWVCCHGNEVWSRLSFLERAGLKRADLLLPVSRFTAKRLCQQGIAASKIKLLYNAILDGLLCRLDSGSGSAKGHRAKESGKVLLSVGSLARQHGYKGFDTVIRALPRILPAAPDLRYIIVGDGDDRSSLRDLAAEMKVADHVTFAGQVTDAELAMHYCRCDLFVLPSRVAERDGRWEGEGFGRVYVEAALAGKPVVGSIAGGAAEAVLPGITGILVDPLSVTEVADAVLSLLQQPNLAASMGREGRRWATENFTPQALRQNLAGMLQPYGFRG